jgi:hypothetical protein
VADDVAEKTEDPRPKHRWLGPALEIVAAFGAMFLVLRLSSGIWVVATDRTAQVSGLAALQLRLLLVAVPAISAMVITAHIRGGKHFAMTSRISCAALAGVATGFIGGGIMLALKGTPWPLNGHNGDSAQLVAWANAYSHDYTPGYPPTFYPPLFPKILSWYAGVSGQDAFFALKDLQIAFTAIVGPLAYLSWRLLLRPGWALGIGVIAALVVIEPYKPYGSVVLVTFLPLMIRFIHEVRNAEKRHWFALVKIGVISGVTFGILTLLYSGWFRWSILGIIVGTLVVFPWRSKVGRKHALILGATATLMLGAMTFSYVTDVTATFKAASGASAPMIPDNYMYFDVSVDPAYFAMWKGDLAGPTQTWPPPGELGGIGVFTLITLAGLALAIALGYRRTIIIVLVPVLVGVWFHRMWAAHYMFTTKYVGLYPRTSAEIVYILIVLSGFALYYLVEIAARRVPDSPLRNPPAMIGAVTAMTMLIGLMASSISDKYMPTDVFPFATGWLSWQAHLSKKENVNPDDWRMPPADVVWPPP